MKIRTIITQSGLPSFDAFQLIEKVLGFSKPQLLLHMEEELAPKLESDFFSLVKKRKEGYPLQYLLGEWDFFGLSFFVGEGVLIPRQDTESVVEVCLSLLSGSSAPNICDLCSGTGCIPIALSKHLPAEASITAVELSDQAMVYLTRNVSRHACGNLQVLQDDVTTWQPQNAKPFDLIVSNPPYLTPAEMDCLQLEVKFEPKMALVAQGSGLYFYQTISQRYLSFLKPGGSLVFEVGYNQAEPVCGILEQAGYVDILCSSDLCGIDRVVSAKKLL